MKKLFFSLCLFLAMSSVYAQTFAPDPNKVYNIVESGSQLVVGAPPAGSIQPILTVLKNLESQAFNFIPTGAPDTYNILSADNMYLNFQTAQSWDHWSCALEPTLNGTYSEWVIVGTDSTGIRLYNKFQFDDPGHGAEKCYLGTDGTSAGSGFYCDKSSSHWSGLYQLKVATIDQTPTFSVANKVVIEIEKATPYPIYVSATKQNYDIDATISAGFSLYNSNFALVDKLTFTPKNFTDNGGKISFPIQETTAAVGDTGKVIFSYTSGGVMHKLDSIAITSVVPYSRVIIKNNASKFVIASDPNNSTTPMLDTLTIENGSEYFYLRPVHKNVNDSLYYIIQDGDYKAFMKDIGSGYKTQFGVLEDSLSVWKIIPMANGVKRIQSMARLETNHDLGTDDTWIGSGIWLDKTFKSNPNSGPWCEWTILSAAVALNPASSVLASVALSTGSLDKTFDGATLSYDVFVPADVDTVKITGTTLATISTIAVNPDTLVAGRSAVLTVVSQDLTSTTDYTFNLKKYTFDQWASGGEVDAIPTKYGWKCPNAKWAVANSADSTYARYFDNPVNYKYKGEAWTGRALLINWDGNVTDTVAYSYPVSLEGGKSYKFAGKYAWVSGISVDYTAIPVDTLSSTFTFGIRTALDATGTTIASVDSVVNTKDSLNMKNFKDVSLTFTPETSGVYYLTIKNNSTIKAAIADLSISRTDGFKNVLSSNIYAYVSNDMINIHGTLAGDAVKVYNISGQLVKQLTATSDITSINLKSGVYLIKVNANVLKVIK